jgi:hypothetical protein
MKKTRKKTPIERFLALSDAQKEAEVAPYEKQKVKSRALTPSERKFWESVKRGGRPRVGEGAAIVPVSIERGLLRKVDAFANANHLKRSQMVAEGLRIVMQRKAG